MQDEQPDAVVVAVRITGPLDIWRDANRRLHAEHRLLVGGGTNTRPRRAARSRQVDPFGGIDGGVQAALLFRPKDLVDLERLVAVQGARLDAPYVRRWLIDMVGDDDPRVLRWEQIVATFATPA